MAPDEHRPATPIAQPAAPLADVIGALQRRWGPAAIRRGPPEERAGPPLPTGLPPLDELLGGGAPAGALTELLGAPTSGATTVALRALAQAQRSGRAAALVDLGGTFDAEYAAACGVDLGALLLARPERADEALELLQALVVAGVGAVAVDSLAWLQAAESGRTMLSAALRLLLRTLAPTPCAVLALTYLPYPPEVAGALASRGSALAQAAALRVHFARRAWETGDPQAPACRVRALVLRRRGGASGGAAELTVPFADGWGGA